EIDESTERSLYTHYGLSYSERRSGSTLPEGGPGMTGERPGTMGTGDEADVRGRSDVQGETDVQGEGAVTRHEEELRVGTQDVEAGRARVRKWVETEPEQVDVALRRETARVTREPVDRPAGDVEIGEEEIDVPLRGEEAVVEKETVAKERVGLEKDVETQRETVGGEVRKEQIDVEGDVDRR
ncbi:MAG TPA: YsnF/AvaK domain-containing protein, partial [Gaiellaceae bacterium]|nr:YsnF/AvaK domain-containing protein [Gaiellaceae bacterium]